MLQMPQEWVFGSPGVMPDGAVRDFFDLVVKIAAQGDNWPILEMFKADLGFTSRSSTPDWALSDLERALEASSANAPLLIAAFWRGRGRVEAQYPGHPLPDEHVVNALLLRHGVPYEIHPPVLRLRSGAVAPPVSVPEVSVSASAKALIEASLAQADKFLLEHKPRQAVQEILWLLETVSTAFRGQEYGGGTVEGKYFNEIVRELRKHSGGTVLAQAGAWMATLHGFLSSPTGGGVRHGVELSTATDLKIHEATLYCNLTRSYIGYLLAELASRAEAF